MDSNWVMFDSTSSSSGRENPSTPQNQVLDGIIRKLFHLRRISRLLQCRRKWL